MLIAKTWLSALAGALLLLSSGSALAQGGGDGSVWVSRSGDNDNDCFTPATACRFFGPGGGGALSKVAAGGTIHVLPGVYDSPVLHQSVQIIADDGGEPEVTATVSAVGSAEAAFVIDAGPNDVVRIRGMILNPTGFGSAIALIAGGALHVENCTLIASNEKSAIDFAPTGASELYVSNCKISENGTASGGSGILIRPTGSGSAKAVLDNVSVVNNAAGVHVDGRNTSGAINVTVSNSVLSGNGTFGLRADESGAGSINVMVELSRSTNNGTNGVLAVGANATIRMRNSTSTGNIINGVVVSGGGQLISHGGNVVAGNTTNGSFTGTFAQQ
jgi:hypothetical protein